MRMNGSELQQATRGTWHKGIPAMVQGIGTDSRNFEVGHAFLALRGPSFDGHVFADQVADKASALIGDAQGMALWQAFELPQLQVDDTLQALGDIATAWRARLADTTVFAITGSFGKTTVRSMLAHTFNALGVKAHATHANLNNLIGVPMTLLGTPEESEVALIECGISEKGEMMRLSEIVRPDVAIITGITSAHGEGLGGVHGVAGEKAKLLEHLHPQGWYALGYGVRAHLQALGQATSQASLNMDDNGENIVTWQLNGDVATFHRENEQVDLKLALPARHWVANMALTATTVLNYFRLNGRDIALSEAISALQSWMPVSGRLQQIGGIGGCTVLDDSYNANPVSMQAAIDTLAALSGNRIAILGDMGELGDESASAHAAIRLAGVDRALLIGEQMRRLADTHPQTEWFASTEAALAWIGDNSNMFDGDTYVLVKASRFMGLDRIVQALKKEEARHAL